MQQRQRNNDKQVLGDRATWGKVGYTGAAHVAADGTYPGIDAVGLRYTTINDSGRYPMPGNGAPLANLVPLIMMELHEVGFAQEAGPLTSWSN